MSKLSKSLEILKSRNFRVKSNSYSQAMQRNDSEIRSWWNSPSNNASLQQTQ